MGIIEYFRGLRRRFLERRQFQTERIERFYAKCREGIFSFFRPYLTKTGFYLDLEDKKGLTDYFSESRQANRTVESLVSKEVPTPKVSNLWNKAEEYTKPIYGVFKRMINYFNEFPKGELGSYSSLSFNYVPSMAGYEVDRYKNKLSFRFG
jgi:hypothetical protein